MLQNLKFRIQPFSVTTVKISPKSTFYAFEVINVQWVTMVSLSGLCIATPKNPQNDRVYEPAATIRRHVIIHLSVCCGPIPPSASR